MTYGNQSEEGARAHAVLMTIRETCNLEGELLRLRMGYLSRPTSNAKRVRKIKMAVQSFARYELERLKLVGDIPLENIQLKNTVEIEQILSKLKSDRYDRIKDLR